MLRLSFAALTLTAVAACAGTTTSRVETHVTQGPGASQFVNSTSSVNGEVVSSLKQQWESEVITATGSAPVVNKYPEPMRNRELARRGAILDGERNLAQQVSQLKITSTVTMADLETNDFVRSQMNALVQNVEVVQERYDEKNERYEVTVRMPKIKVVNIIEEYTHRP
jgi:hypothetical protein